MSTRVVSLLLSRVIALVILITSEKVLQDIFAELRLPCHSLVSLPCSRY